MTEHPYFDLELLSRYNPQVDPDNPEIIDFENIGEYRAKIVRLLRMIQEAKIEIFFWSKTEEFLGGAITINDPASIHRYLSYTNITDQDSVREFFNLLRHSFNKKRSSGMTLEVPTWKEIMLSPEKKFEWIIYPIIARGDVAIIGGPKNVGKSSLLGEICIACFTSRPFLGEFPVKLTEPQPILWIDMEMGAHHFRQRAEKTIKTVSADMLDWVRVLDWNALMAQYGEMPSPLVGSGFATIKRIVKELKPILIFIDPVMSLLAASGTTDIYNPAVLRQYLGQPAKILASFGNCGIIPIDHTGKDITRGLIGSIDKEGAADAIIMHLPHARSNELSSITLSKLRAVDTEPYDKGYQLDLRYSKLTHRAISDQMLSQMSPQEREELGFTLVQSLPEDEDTQEAAKEAAIRSARDYLERFPEATDEEIAGAIGKGKTTIWRWRKEGKL